MTPYPVLHSVIPLRALMWKLVETHSNFGLRYVNFSQVLCSSSTWTWIRKFLGERRAVWYKRSSGCRHDNVKRLQLQFTTTLKPEMFYSSTVVGFCTKTSWKLVPCISPILPVN
jgi:hypothetical protein